MKTLKPLLAQMIPSRREAAFVFRNVLFVGVEWPVRRGVGGVEEEWLVWTALVVLPDEVGSLIADRVSEEEVLG